MPKNPENYFMRLGKYAYDPFESGDSVYIRIAHRGAPTFVSLVQVVETESGYAYNFVSSTMPTACVNEFIETLQRNTSLLIRQGRENKIWLPF